MVRALNIARTRAFTEKLLLLTIRALGLPVCRVPTRAPVWVKLLTLALLLLIMAAKPPRRERALRSNKTLSAPFALGVRLQVVGTFSSIEKSSSIVVATVKSPPTVRLFPAVLPPPLV